jgi:hypothetical protein
MPCCGRLPLQGVEGAQAAAGATWTPEPHGAPCCRPRCRSKGCGRGLSAPSGTCCSGQPAAPSRRCPTGPAMCSCMGRWFLTWPRQGRRCCRTAAEARRAAIALVPLYSFLALCLGSSPHPPPSSLRVESARPSTCRLQLRRSAAASRRPRAGARWRRADSRLAPEASSGRQRGPRGPGPGLRAGPPA